MPCQQAWGCIRMPAAAACPGTKLRGASRSVCTLCWRQGFAVQRRTSIQAGPGSAMCMHRWASSASWWVSMFWWGRQCYQITGQACFCRTFHAPALACLPHICALMFRTAQTAVRCQNHKRLIQSARITPRFIHQAPLLEEQQLDACSRATPQRDDHAQAARDCLRHALHEAEPSWGFKVTQRRQSNSTRGFRPAAADVLCRQLVYKQRRCSGHS